MSRLVPAGEEKRICRIGEGPYCCRYLVCGAEGFECAKNTELKGLLDDRVAAKSMSAQGDNCPGLGPKLASVTRVIHLNTPAQARAFLRSIRGPNGEQVSTVGLADGRTIPLEEANDEAVVGFARTMALAIGKAVAQAEHNSMSAVPTLPLGDA